MSGFRAASDAVEFDMAYITGYDRSQLLLLPELFGNERVHRAKIVVVE